MTMLKRQMICIRIKTSIKKVDTDGVTRLYDEKNIGIGNLRNREGNKYVIFVFSMWL